MHSYYNITDNIGDGVVVRGGMMFKKLGHSSKTKISKLMDTSYINGQSAMASCRR